MRPEEESGCRRGGWLGLDEESGRRDLGEQMINECVTNEITMSKPAKRMAYGSAIQHIYKRTIDKGVLFYRTEDRLVYYTITAVKAWKHKIDILAMCLMFTHIHRAVRALDAVQLTWFERDVDATFVREYNLDTGRVGPVFETPFGRSCKRDEKEIRTCLIYIFNNPVEKKLCRRAVEDRWNFLAYYDRKFPFSARPVLRHERLCLREALKVVEHECRAGRYLRFALLRRLFEPLSPDEREILTDHIIQVYFPFDRETCHALFKTAESMRLAPDQVSGSDFEIGEEFEKNTDEPYRTMCALVKKYGMLGEGMPLFHLSPERRMKLKHFLMLQTQAAGWQVERFLHQS